MLERCVRMCPVHGRHGAKCRALLDTVRRLDFDFLTIGRLALRRRDPTDMAWHSELNAKGRNADWREDSAVRQAARR
jgi:hypothetical protein